MSGFWFVDFVVIGLFQDCCGFGYCERLSVVWFVFVCVFCLIFDCLVGLILFDLLPCMLGLLLWDGLFGLLGCCF